MPTASQKKIFFVEYVFGSRGYKRVEADDVWECMRKFADWTGVLNPNSCQYIGDRTAVALWEALSEEETLLSIFQLFRNYSEYHIVDIYQVASVAC